MQHNKRLGILLAGMVVFVSALPVAQAALTGTQSITSSTHQANTSSTLSTVTLNWSGVTAGGTINYEYVLDQVSTTGSSASAFQSQFGATATSTLKHADLGTVTTVDLASLVDGTWYFHLRTSDSGDPAASILTTFGPIILDSAPTISTTTSITPATGDHKAAISVTINGSKFMSGASVDLIQAATTVALTNVTVVSSTRITATVPANTAPATYDLRVTNAAPFNKQTTKNAAYQSTNQTPVANAGTDSNLTLNAGSSVQLALVGTASSDADSDPLTYTWTTVADPSGQLQSSFTSSTKNLTVSKAGTYTFSLTVNDGFIDSAAKQVNFVVTAANTNNPPVANAGADQTVAPSALVGLSGSQSSDPDGNPLTYAWTFATTGGKPASSVLTNTSILQPNGTSNAAANFTPDVSGTYTINLIVNDGTVDSAVDAVVITANAKPTANAGPAQNNLQRNRLVTLDGSGSSDPESGTLTYAWTIASQPAGSNITLSSTTVVGPTFTPVLAGTYTFSLVVKDPLSQASTNNAQVSITILAASLDVDGSGTSDANDGVMILRRKNGAGTVTTGIVLPAGATNTSVVTAIDNAANAFDADGDGDSDANDGVMILRRLNGAGTVSTGIVLPLAVGGAGASGERNETEITGAIDGLK